MTKLRLALACLTSGAIWSVSYLVVIEALHQSTDAQTALLLAWPLKIAWSTIHTAVSRWRGTKSITVTGTAQGCQVCIA